MLILGDGQGKKINGDFSFRHVFGPINGLYGHSFDGVDSHGLPVLFASKYQVPIQSQIVGDGTPATKEVESPHEIDRIHTRPPHLFPGKMIEPDPTRKPHQGSSFCPGLLDLEKVLFLNFFGSTLRNGETEGLRLVARFIEDQIYRTLHGQLIVSLDDQTQFLLR